MRMTVFLVLDRTLGGSVLYQCDATSPYVSYVIADVVQTRIDMLWNLKV